LKRDGKITIQLVTTPPKVFLIGAPAFNMENMQAYLEYRGEVWNDYNEEDVTDAERITEVFGRVCYASLSNPAKRTTGEYISQQIIAAKHGSVLEHTNFNFLVADIPRSTQLELVRHGDGTAFSFESTRFTDKHLRFVVPPHIRNDLSEVARFEEEVSNHADAYYRSVQSLSERYRALYGDDKTLARKRAKEASRALLPNSQGSDGGVTMNSRALRWIIESRTNEHADLSIREFGWEVFKVAEPYFPSLFDDVNITTVKEGMPQVGFTYSKV
jgi:thymidylate synthase (FAD)